MSEEPTLSASENTAADRASPDRPWHSIYPAGVPRDIDPDRWPSLVSLIEESFSRHADRPAFECMGRRISFAELDRLSADFASWVGRLPGVKPGDRIALMMPNILQYPVALFGALRAGLVVVNTNPLYTARELRHQLSDSGAKVVVVMENFAHVVAACIENSVLEHVLVTGFGDMLGAPKSWFVNAALRYLRRSVPPFSIPGARRWRRALAAGRRAGAFPAPPVGRDDIALLQYTGGTTGGAKGAILTHRNMVANVLQVEVFFAPFVRPGEEVIITALPLCHIFALTANGLAFFRFGAMNLLIPNPRDLAGFVKTLSRRRFSAMTGVNTLFNGLMNTPGFSALDFSDLRLVVGGGMAVQEGVAKRWQETTGVVLLEGYGLTEASPAVCIMPADSEAFTGAAGVPLPGTQCKVIDDAGTSLGAGEPGELCVHGPQVMRGYWRRPHESAQVVDESGWLRTGDIATIDERGFIRIVDRKKDVIIVSGFNVYPNEIEDLIASHPDVLEAGVIGVKDEHGDEAVKAMVVKRSPTLTEEELRAYCKEHAVGYKRPRDIEFVESLPKSHVGKILRRDLRESKG